MAQADKSTTFTAIEFKYWKAVRNDTSEYVSYESYLGSHHNSAIISYNTWVDEEIVLNFLFYKLGMTLPSLGLFVKVN